MRVFNCGFIVLFMVMIMLPLVFLDLSSDRISKEENRMLAERPKLADIKRQPETFIQNFDTWFKDSTGFRKQLIYLYQLIDKNKWLNAVVRYTDGQYVYLIGKKGHHYFAHVDGFLIPKFQGKQFLSDEQLANMANKLEEVKTYLDKNGIPMVVMFCADKESIYPEFYPKSIKQAPEPIQLDIITNYLQKHTNIDVFNIRQALLAEKHNYLLYHKIDTMAFSGDFAHYNEIGAFFAYRELMKYINIYFPKLVPYELNDVVISYDEKERPIVSLKTEILYRKLDPSFTWEDEIYQNTNNNLPVMLCLRDSYFDERLVGKYLAQHFGKVIFIHWFNINKIEEYIIQYKPDIVVFESAERELRGFANSVAEIPQIPLKKKTISTNQLDTYKLLKESKQYNKLDFIQIIDNVAEYKFNIDYINNPITPSEIALSFDKKQGILINGWAIDIINDTSPYGVYIKLNEKIYDTRLNDRGDVANYFNKIRYLKSGFEAYISSDFLVEKNYKLSLCIITEDGERYFEIKDILDFSIVE
jgi:hypothetical protein